LSFIIQRESNPEHNMQRSRLLPNTINASPAVTSMRQPVCASNATLALVIAPANEYFNTVTTT